MTQDSHTAQSVSLSLGSSETDLGEICGRTYAMPKDANANGDIFGGWLLSQMDLAAAVVGTRVSQGRIVTLALDAMKFLKPVNVGDLVTCYGKVIKIGNTSMSIRVTAVAQKWGQLGDQEVTEGTFTMVAIDDEGRPRPVPQ